MKGAILILPLLALVSCTQALNCYVGYLNSSLGGDAFNSSACPSMPENKCIRVDVSGVAGVVPFHASGLACVPMANCSNIMASVENCRAATQSILKQVAPTLVTFAGFIGPCEAACCGTDNCNNETVASMKMAYTPTASVDMSSTTKSMPMSSSTSKPPMTTTSAAAATAPFRVLAQLAAVFGMLAWAQMQ